MNVPGFCMRLRLSVLTASILALLASCNTEKRYQHRESDRIEAELTATRFYEILKKDSLDGIRELLTEELRKEPLPENVKQYAKYLNDSLGTVREITLDEWGSMVVEGLDSRSDYELVYRVARSRRVSRESLVLRKEAGEIRIRGWRAASDGMELPTTPIPANATK